MGALTFNYVHVVTKSIYVRIKTNEYAQELNLDKVDLLLYHLFTRMSM